MNLFTVDGKLIFNGEQIHEFVKKTSTHNLAGRRVDVWFKLGGIIYWGVQYGIWNEKIHIKATKQAVIRGEK